MRLRTSRSKGIVALPVIAIVLAGCGGGSSRGSTLGAKPSVSTSNASQTATATANSSQTSTVPVEQTLSLNLAASPEHVERGGFSTLSWDATSASRCTAAGGWQGDQPVSGAVTVYPVDVTTRYELNCEGVEARGEERVIVKVVSRAIRWSAPTQNVDGSPLTDLAGYVIYWGLESSTYTDSHRLESPTATEWLLEVPPGTFYVAMTSFDSEGNESEFSNEVLKVVF